MPRKILLIFWGHPLFDGRCVNMMEQLFKKKYDVKVLGVGFKAENMNYKNIAIKLIDKHTLESSITKYFKYFSLSDLLVTAVTL